jgi:hypothetical protein
MRVALTFFLSKRANKHSYENAKFNIFRSFPCSEKTIHSKWQNSFRVEPFMLPQPQDSRVYTCLFIDAFARDFVAIIWTWNTSIRQWYEIRLLKNGSSFLLQYSKSLISEDAIISEISSHFSPKSNFLPICKL